MLKNLWNDESGVILSAEIVLVGTILVMGMIVGLVELQYAVVSELSDLGDAIGNLDQSYEFGAIESSDLLHIKAKTYGGQFNDGPDNCDCSPLVFCNPGGEKPAPVVP